MDRKANIMKNNIGQALEPGMLVAKSEDRNGYLKYGVIVSINEDARTAKVKWTHENNWHGSHLGPAYQCVSRSRLGDNHVDKLAVIEWMSIPQWMRDEINERLKGLLEVEES